MGSLYALKGLREGSTERPAEELHQLFSADILPHPVPAPMRCLAERHVQVKVVLTMEDGARLEA